MAPALMSSAFNVRIIPFIQLRLIWGRRPNCPRFFRSSLTKMLQLLLVSLNRALALAPINFCFLILCVDDALGESKQRMLKDKEPQGTTGIFQEELDRKQLRVYSVENVPTSDRSQNRTVVPCRSPEHVLLATPLLLCAQQLCRAGQSPSLFLFQRF